MPEKRKLKVFLCHSKDDKPQVWKFYRGLVADGFDAWLDEEKLIPGQDWELEIEKAVRNADAVVVFLSKGSVTKEGYIQKEIRLALDVADEKPEGTIYLIPARLEVCNVPNRISRFQWVDLFTENGYQKLKDSLQLKMNDINIRFASNEVLPRTDSDTISVPILGSISTGLPLPMLEPHTGHKYAEANGVEIATELLPPKVRGTDLYALEVKGDSFTDAMINDGDIVVLKNVTKARNGEMVALWLPYAKEATLKYFFKEKDRYRLQPADPTMKPIYVNKDEPIEIKGKVVMVIRKVEYQ